MDIGVLMPDTAGMTRWKESEMKRISIVVPVFNSEKYLTETLDSLAAQTYPNFEVLLIDDGSTDKSSQICIARTEVDKRFRYYKIDNNGPSVARNTGILLATGEYIGFCDSDDLIDPDMYETMVAYMENHLADIVFCDIYSERDQKSFGLQWPDKTVFRLEDISETLVPAFVGNETDNDSNVPLWGSVVRCLFKSNLIKDNSVSFPGDIHFAEDLVFTLRYLQNVKVAVICDKAFYYYRCNPDSIMNSFFTYKEGMFEDRKKLLQYLSKIIDGFTVKDGLQKRLIVTSRCYFRECVGNACRTAEGRTKKKMKHELKKILNDDDVVAAFANFDAVNPKIKMISLLIKYRCSFAIWAYYSCRFYKR